MLDTGEGDFIGSNCYVCRNRPCEHINRYFDDSMLKMSDEEFDALYLRLHGLCDDFEESEVKNA